nr:thioesterase family protein [Aliiroseovarius subalbicans]
MQVVPDWLDYNGHMNMAYYNVLIDRAGDEMYSLMGLGEAYAKTRAHTSYTAEFHICYVRELHLGDRVQVQSQLLEFDAKRFITWHEVWHVDGWLAATGEALGLHIDMSGPRVVPFPDDVRAKMLALKATQADLPRPDRAGRAIALPG